MQLTLRLALLSAVAGLVVPALLADEKSQQPITDEQFVMKASAAGLAEVNLGRIAAERAPNEEIMKFGQRMVDDHTKANRELLDLAAKKKFTAADRMNPDHQQCFDKLSKLDGKELDRQFMSQMVKDHEEAVDLFTNEAKNGKDDDLKAFAAKTLPTLKEHQKMAKELNDKVK